MKILKSSFFHKKRENAEFCTRLRSTDKGILFVFYSLMLIGMIIVVSASYSATRVYSLSAGYFVVKHVIFCIISISSMRFFSKRTDQSSNYYERFGTILWYVCIVLLIYILLFSNPIKGARRWIQIFGFSIQISEFVKLAVALEGVRLLGQWNRFAIAYIVPIILLILQPDLGDCLVLVGLAAAQVFIRYFNIKYLSLLGSASLALIGLAYSLFAHVRSRLNLFLNPSMDIYGVGFQIQKSFLAIKNGGLIGLGFGKGIVKNFLPDAHTDFVFSVLIEEFGAITGAFVIFLFVFLAYRVLQLQPENEKAAAIQYSLVILVLMQAWLNIASVLALIPTKGLALPFISYGGSSIVAQGILFGILLGVSNTKSRVKQILQ